MPNTNKELSGWHDWTDPDFFQNPRSRNEGIRSLFLRQLLPTRFQKTKLTLIGWMLILVALGIGSAAYNTASNILFMTLSLLLSSLVLSGILSFINFRRLKWELQAPHHLQVGELGMAQVDVVNEKTVFPTMSICFSVGSSASEVNEPLYFQSALIAGAKAKLEWTFVPQQRGRCDVFLSGVESQFPFGFLKKVMGREVRETVLVWPESIEFTFDPDNNGQRFLSGRSKRNAGMGSDLLNLRPYVAGDPPRLVHWKATARLGKLMIRQLAQEEEAGYHLVLNTDSAVWNRENFESLCSAAGSLAESLFHAGRLETITINDQTAVSVGSMRELHSYFDELALLERVTPSSEETAKFVRNVVTFRPLGERDVAFYVDEKQAGQTQ